MENLDPRLFFQIFHAMLRANSLADEAERSTRVLTWLSENLPTVSRVCERAQKNLLGIVYQHWLDHASAPSYTILESLVRKQDKPDAMIDLLKEYESIKSDLDEYDDMDMPALLAERKEDWEKAVIADLLRMAQQINKGARDAMAYIFEKLQQGALVDDQRAMGGSLRDNVEAVADSYNRTEIETHSGKLLIPTTFAEMDAVIGGLRRKHLVGILGFTGQRKSAVGRTIAYAAAEKGFRILHIPLESSAEEEFNIYGVMHSHHRNFANHPLKGLSYKDFDNGAFTAEEKAFLEDEVLPDLRSTLRGDIIVRQPVDRTWAGIKALIEMEQRIQPIDLIFIDYLSYIDVSHEKNQVEAINNIIREAKKLCLTFDGGRGVTLLTPIQGSREGNTRAVAAGGVWDKGGIGQFNEFEKTLDLLLYVFQDQELQAQDQLKMGTCKSRRSADALVTTYSIPADSGIVQSMTDANQMDIDDVDLEKNRRTLDYAY
jgi:archaellum biogenesis ATPase FlaH